MGVFFSTHCLLVFYLSNSYLSEVIGKLQMSAVLWPIKQGLTIPLRSPRGQELLLDGGAIKGLSAAFRLLLPHNTVIYCQRDLIEAKELLPGELIALAT